MPVVIGGVTYHRTQMERRRLADQHVAGNNETLPDVVVSRCHRTFFPEQPVHQSLASDVGEGVHMLHTDEGIATTRI